MAHPGPPTPYQPWREPSVRPPSEQDRPFDQDPAPPVYLPPPQAPYVPGPAVAPYGLVRRSRRRVWLPWVVIASLLVPVLCVLACFPSASGAFFRGVVDAVGGSGPKPAATATMVDLDEMRVGMCVNAVYTEAAVEWPVVACASAHTGEVVGVFKLPKGGYPGKSALTRRADDGCTKRYKDYTASRAGDVPVRMYFLMPTKNQWTMGQREVTCVAAFMKGPLTGSLKG